MAARGFRVDDGALYMGAHGSTDNCVSHVQSTITVYKSNKRSSHFLNDKLAFAMLMQYSGLPHPRVYGHTCSGSVLWIGKGEEEVKRDDDLNKPVVVKPRFGAKGQGVRFVRGGRLDEARFGPDRLVTEYVEQDEYAKRIFPLAANTIRVVTMCLEERAPFIACAVHRFGSTESGGVDNFSAGGVVASIDKETGVMGKGASLNSRDQLQWHDAHPDTAVRIEGKTVARWSEVVAVVIRLARTFPFLRYVGWDVLVTSSGPVVIEGNRFPDLDLMQIHQPLLDNPEAKEFYEWAMVRGG